MTCLPSGEKATEITDAEWPLNVWSAAPVVASHSRTVRSVEPEMTCLVFGEKATELTHPKWPSSVCSAAPTVASQSRTVLSLEPETTPSIIFPSTIFVRTRYIFTTKLRRTVS